MIAVDTNVLLRYLLQDDELQAARADAIFNTAETILITDTRSASTATSIGTRRCGRDKALPHEMDADLTHLVSRGDILMSRASGSVGLVGSVAMVEREPAAKLLLSDKIFRLRFDPTRTSGRYLVFAMGAPPFRHQITTIISGAEGLANNIAKSDVLELSIAVPPFKEQHAIADHLDRKMTALNTLARRTRDTISLLNERRSALIAAAVTGQIDIRATS